MFIIETIMFNLERANQFFMLIMNRPAVPASLFMELREQAHVPGQAPLISAMGGPTSKRDPPWPCLCHLGGDSWCVCGVVGGWVGVCVCMSARTYVYVHVYEHVFVTKEAKLIPGGEPDLSVCVCVHTCLEDG